MHVLSRTDNVVTFVVAGRVCEVTPEEYARIMTRVQTRARATRATRALMRESTAGRMQALVG